ncbi:MAG: hypothetical protein GVY18_04260 [Bacteroidetes bacterium]|jgi:hypothetical protein|nr:hypothetical protein [Bacteroidota bacterium]
MATYNLDITLDNGVWKVQDASGSSDPPEVQAGDVINWDCNDADVEFQFPEDDLFVNQSGYTSSLSAGGQLSKTVASQSGQAGDKTVVYAAYCTPDGKGSAGYAEGSTPPKMIIKPG